MALPRFFVNKKRTAIIAVVLMAGVAWLGFALFPSANQPGQPVAGEEAVGSGNEARPGDAFIEANSKLEEMMRQQKLLSQQAALIAEPTDTGKAQAAGAPNAIAKLESEKKLKTDLSRHQMEMLMAARETAVKEIMKTGQGDSKKIIAVMEKLDAQMRAAGVPSVIDMPKFRQMMLSADRIQDISKRLNAENQKGQQADPAKLRSLVSELSAAQAAMPKTPYDPAVLERVMKSGR